MRDTLAILGSHPRTRDQFDFSRDADVWAFNESVSGKQEWLKRVDAVFQMHIPTIWRNPKNRNDEGHYEWLKYQREIPIYMQDKYEDVPMSIKYPLEEIREMMDDDDHFLTSSPAMAMALGVYQGYKRIEIYGVAMETDTEYGFQREGVAFWRGFAEGRGVDVYFADNTFRTPLYGYEGEVFIRYEKFDERINDLTPLFEKAEKEYNEYVKGFSKIVENFAKDASKENEKALYIASGTQRQLVEQAGLYDGAIYENQRYKEKADAMKGVTDNFVFSRQEFEGAAQGIKKPILEAEKAVVSLGTMLANAHVLIRTAAKDSPKQKKAVEAYMSLIKKYLDAAKTAAFYKGAMAENREYMVYLDKHIKAAGGSKSEEVILNAGG